MSDRSPEEPISLAELDARHDDLLAQLDELDQRIQAVLKEHAPKKQTVPPIASTDGDFGSSGVPPMSIPIDMPAVAN